MLPLNSLHLHTYQTPALHTHKKVNGGGVLQSPHTSFGHSPHSPNRTRAMDVNPALVQHRLFIVYNVGVYYVWFVIKHEVDYKMSFQNRFTLENLQEMGLKRLRSLPSIPFC